MYTSDTYYYFVSTHARHRNEGGLVRVGVHVESFRS